MLVSLLFHFKKLQLVVGDISFKKPKRQCNGGAPLGSPKCVFCFLTVDFHHEYKPELRHPSADNQL